MSERLSTVDTAWLRMDRPTNLMMICGVMMLDGQPDLQHLRSVIENRMLCFHRFRQRVVDHGFAAHWVTDAHFELDWHVRRIALPGKGGHDELEQVVGDLISTPLDPSKPMWQFHLIEKSDGNSALLLRIHHCYGDGFALMHVVNAMTDLESQPAIIHCEDLNPVSTPRSTWERVLGPVTEAVVDASRMAGKLVGLEIDLMTKPLLAMDMTKTGIGLATESAFIANMKPDSVTGLKGELGIMKRVAWTHAISLFEVKAVADALSCSVNDVLLACVSGALREYLIGQGDTVDELGIRAMVPVNMRPKGPVRELGNHFGLVFLDLPVDFADPIERLHEVRDRMTHLKHSQQPMVALGILAAMGIVPDLLRERILETLAANASAVMTNVPGSPDYRYLAGHRINGQIFWVPQSGGIGIGISILSYAGKINFGIVSDIKRVPDPNAVLNFFNAQFETLLDLAMLQFCTQE